MVPHADPSSAFQVKVKRRQPKVCTWSQRPVTFHPDQPLAVHSLVFLLQPPKTKMKGTEKKAKNKTETKANNTEAYLSGWPRTSPRIQQSIKLGLLPFASFEKPGINRREKKTCCATHGSKVALEPLPSVLIPRHADRQFGNLSRMGSATTPEPD